MLDTLLNENLVLALINGALRLDPQAANKLASLNGKRIAITLEPRSDAWVFRISNGELAFDSSAARECDVRLSGTLAGFLRLFRRKDGAPAQTGADERLYIEGDLHTAQTFQHVMGALAPDFSGILRERFGERLGSALAQALEQIRRTGEAGRDQIESRLRDYLGQAFVSRADFSAREQALEQLEARIAALEARLRRHPGEPT